MTPDPPRRAVDAPSPAPSGAAGLSIPQAYAALDSLCVELDHLHAENGALRHDLDAARSERDTAKAQAAHYRTYYSRTGW